jgi:hypothetical protein
MRLVALLAAGFIAASAPASAQYVPRPMAPIGPSSAQDAAEIVEAMGLRPIGVPVRNGSFYVQSARDDLGRVLRVVVDARRSQVVAVESGVPRALYGPYAGYAPHPRAGAPAPYPMEEFDIAPPGSIMGSRMTPNAAVPGVMPPAAQPKPSAKSAAVTPKEPPVPRKRPASAPQQAAGSVEPVAAAPQVAPAPVLEKPAAAQPSAPEKPANAMPPVNSLE